MNPIIALLLDALKQVGFDPQQFAKVAVADALQMIRSGIENHWLKAVPAIAAEMASQGWTLQSVSPERPSPPQDYVGRIQYKLWDRTVPGGKIRDWLRDTENKVVTQLDAAQLSPTDHAHNVRVVIPTVLDVTFEPFLRLVGGGNPTTPTTTPAPGPPVPAN